MPVSQPVTNFGNNTEWPDDRFGADNALARFEVGGRVKQTLRGVLRFAVGYGRKSRFFLILVPTNLFLAHLCCFYTKELNHIHETDKSCCWCCQPDPDGLGTQPPEHH
jgi:hypothetical protein